MIKRIFYTMKNAWRQRKQLRNVQKVHNCAAPFALSAAVFQEQGYETIVFDFDGILAAHGETEPDPQMQTLLQECSARFGDNHVYVLSNKPSMRRLRYFEAHFPQVRFVIAAQKKPYPDGLNKIMQLSGSRPDKILLIDDRLLTGALAAVMAKTHICYVKEPLVNYQRRPLTETFFQCLRYLERALFKTK